MRAQGIEGGAHICLEARTAYSENSMMGHKAPGGGHMGHKAPGEGTCPVSSFKAYHGAHAEL